jgi:hypothetical protein
MKKIICIILLVLVLPQFSEAQKDSLKALELITAKWEIKRINFDEKDKINIEIKKSKNQKVTFTKAGKVIYEDSKIPAEQWKLDWKNKRVMIYTFMDHPQYFAIKKLSRRKMVLYLDNKKTGGFSVIYKPTE